MRKSSYRNINITVTLLLIVMVLVCCKKPAIEIFNPAKMFKPVSVTVAVEDTFAKLVWPKSLFAGGKNVKYTVQIAADSAFQTPVLFQYTTASTSLTLTQDSVNIKTIYFARVKADSSAGSAESDWMVSARFIIPGKPVFLPVSNADITDKAVVLKWVVAPGFTKIVLTPATGAAVEVALTAGDNLAGMKIVNSLLPNTSYKAVLYAGPKLKDEVSFITKLAITGSNVINLTGIDNRSSVLFDTLSKVPSGSLVLLKRGNTYVIPSIYTFDRSVTIMSDFGFGDAARISLGNNFDATGNIDSIRLSDVILTTSGAGYFLYVSNVAVINKLYVENCQTEGAFSNSFIRLKSSGEVISNLYINNSVIDSFGISGKMAVLYSNTANSKIDNIQITNSSFYSFYYFNRQIGPMTASLVINNCTFNDMINEGGYFANADIASPILTISNTIFGKTIDPLNSNWIKSSAKPVVMNSYNTTDCVFSANKTSGTVTYTGTAADLFVNAAAGNLKIKDNSFTGKSTAGDPRWR